MAQKILLPSNNKKYFLMGFLCMLIFSPLIAQTTIMLNGSIGSENFGESITLLTNGNYVVTDSYYDEGGIIDIGAVYLYDGQTHTLISTLKGEQTEDRVGSNGVIALNNGNYVISSPYWDNDAIVDVGAVTWCNGITGKTGTISSSNSLVGGTAYDNISSTYDDGIRTTPLSNGHYVVNSPDWDNGLITNAGAITWCDGTTGRTGLINSSNSLIESTVQDWVGFFRLFLLANGDYIAINPFWDNGSFSSAAAVTWNDANGGAIGTINSCNSVMGTVANSQLRYA